MKPSSPHSSGRIREDDELVRHRQRSPSPIVVDEGNVGASNRSEEVSLDPNGSINMRLNEP